MGFFRRTYCKYLPPTLLLACCSLSVTAQQPPRPSCPSRPIVVGLYEFGRYYQAGAGLDKDVADQLAARSGCKFDLRVMLRSRIWQELQGGGVDLTLSAAAPAERKVFSWAIPYLWSKNMVILHKDADAGMRSTADFIAAPSMRLGLARGHFIGVPYDGFVSQLRNIARVDDADSTDQLFAKFKAGRYQAILGSQMVYSAYLKEGEAKIVDWAPAAPRFATHLLLSKKTFTSVEAKRWEALMKDMISDGSMQRMLERYVPPADAARMLAP